MRQRLILAAVAGCFFFSHCAKEAPSGHHIQLLLDWKAQMEHAGFFVAKRTGYYQAEGLTVEILEGNGAPTPAQRVGTGTYRLGVSSGSATVIARTKGIPVVSLAVINQHSPVVVYSLRKNEIRGPADLPGRRIGVNLGGTKHREFQAFLKKVGIGERDLHLIGMTESSPAPLLAGKVDAMLGYTEDQPVSVELRGHEVNRIALSDFGIDLYSTNIITNQHYLAEDPDVVRRFLRASLKGWQTAVADPEQALSAYMAARPESDPEFNRANFEQLIPLLRSSETERRGLGAQQAERWKETRNVLFDLEMIDRKLDVAEIFTDRFHPSLPELGVVD